MRGVLVEICYADVDDFVPYLREDRLQYDAFPDDLNSKWFRACVPADQHFDMFANRAAEAADDSLDREAANRLRTDGENPIAFLQTRFSSRLASFHGFDQCAIRMCGDDNTDQPLPPRE